MAGITEPAAVDRRAGLHGRRASTAAPPPLPAAGSQPSLPVLAMRQPSLGQLRGIVRDVRSGWLRAMRFSGRSRSRRWVSRVGI